MKRTLLIIGGSIIGILIIAAFVLFLLPAQTKRDAAVSGFQIRSQQWSGTIRITGDVTFFPTRTLTLEAGTRVLFEKQPDKEGADWTKYADAYIKDHNDPTGREGYGQTHFEITGKILAVGTESEPIVFTSAQSKPDYADWDQLVLFGGSRLENVEVSYAHNGVNINGSGVVVRGSRIHDSLWSCIDVFSAGNTIEDNEVYHCWHQAVGFKKVGENAVRTNRIHDAQLSVNCENGAKPTITGNFFEAAPFNPDCGVIGDNTNEDRPADVAGGTYGGKLIYPAPT